VADLIDAQSLYIAMRNETDEAELVFPYLVDPFMPPSALENLPAGELRRKLVEYVLDTGMPMLATPDILSALIAQNGAEVAGRAPVNWLGVPLRLGSRVHGVLAVQSYSADVRFGETEKSVLNFVSQHIAGAIRRKQAESALRASEERFRAIFENSALGIFQTSLDGRLLMANQAYAQMFGYPSPEAAVQHMTDVARMAYVAPEQRQHYYQLALSQPGVIRFETEFRRRDGDVFIGDVRLRVVRDDAQRALYLEGFIEDITERKHAEARLRYLYAHDILTGLHNRAYFEEELTRLADSRRYPVGVIMVDVDGLKLVNDLLGHAAGDEVLRQVATLIKESFRAEDVVARIGGDEFAVLLPESDENITDAAVQRMRERLDEYNRSNDRMPIRLSIGFATAEKGASILGALKQADARMYRDKALRGHGSAPLTRA
jgi:diguanylate cyclase (GGDEF)-like protein/PAS domain S-box-containing protein